MLEAGNSSLLERCEHSARAGQFTDHLVQMRPVILGVAEIAEGGTALALENTSHLPRDGLAW
jgi:hypothetical protein